MIGRTVDKYRILSLLGEGGMAQVYLAEQPDLGRKVALKILAPGLVEKPTALKRLHREVRATARLNHPNIIKIFDVGDFEGQIYYTMEVLVGRTIGERVYDGDLLSPDEILGLAEDLLQALAYVHENKLIHRDIKPSNIFYDRHGTGILMDFGIAKDLTLTGLTQTGMLVGTPRYFSPEMVQRKPLDGRSDLFQTTLVLYEALTGKHPIETDDLLALASGTPLPPITAPGKLAPSCSAGLETLLLNGLIAEREGRYPSARAMLDDLARVREGNSLTHLYERPTELSIVAAPPETSAPFPEDEGDEGDTLRLDKSPPSPEPPASIDPPSTGPHPAAVTLDKDPKQRWSRGALSLAVATVAGLVLAWFAAPVYDVKTLQVAPHVRTALVTWRSSHAYPSAIDFHALDDESSRLEARNASKAATRDHRVQLSCLVPGKRYRLRVRFPNGKLGAPVAFTTRKFLITKHSIQHGWGWVEIDLWTSQKATVGIDPGGRGTSPITVLSQGYATHHKLRVDLPESAPETTIPLVFKTKHGETVQLALPAIPSCEEGIKRLVTLLNALNPTALLTGAGKLRDLRQDGRDAFVSRLRDSMAPALKEIARVRRALPGYLDDPKRSIPEILGLYDGLKKLQHLEIATRAKRIKIDCATKELFGSRMRTRYERPFEPTEEFTLPITGKQQFMARSHTEKVRNAGRDPSFVEAILRTKYRNRATLALPLRIDPSRIDKAYVLLPVHSLSPKIYFRVQINGRATLACRIPLGKRRGGLNTIFHTFDPRLLHRGANRLVLTPWDSPGLGPVPALTVLKEVRVGLRLRRPR